MHDNFRKVTLIVPPNSWIVVFNVPAPGQSFGEEVTNRHVSRILVILDRTMDEEHFRQWAYTIEPGEDFRLPPKIE